MTLSPDFLSQLQSILPASAFSLQSYVADVQCNSGGRGATVPDVVGAGLEPHRVHCQCLRSERWRKLVEHLAFRLAEHEPEPDRLREPRQAFGGYL